ncbi:hypothetical protein GWK47_014909 [Chionoecetes opilio]|uniref:Uncharacterized protein n=1 Tax=Chionoecetes opilio TaxID=41210 RepID=A0A8J4XVR8_CHIOP|nr:hypothetical protein GWK47_014909 [Chionoecetes opilio]
MLWMAAAHPHGGGVPCVTGEAYAGPQRSGVRKAVILSNAATSVCPGRTVSGGSRLGSPRSSISSSSRTSRPLPLLPVSSASSLADRWSKIWRSPQSATHDRDSRSRTLHGWVCGSSGWSGVLLGLPHPHHLLCLRMLSSWMSSVTPSGKMGGPLTLVPFSRLPRRRRSPSPASPHRCPSF